jgi:urease accessory protein
MLRATAVVEHGEPFDSVALNYEARHRRRIRLVTEGGAELLLDLAEARHLREGDRLVLEDGRRVLVRAKPEALVEVRSADPTVLIRLAWHLGNRHTLAQITPGALRIWPDHVLEAMLERLGARLNRIEAPFDPESGAYAGSHDHAHGH